MGRVPFGSPTLSDQALMSFASVKIVSMQDADKFNKLCSKFDCDMDLQSGKYYVDAKSIMGIFSLDLSKPLILNADTDDEAKVKETFADFVGEE